MAAKKTASDGMVAVRCRTAEVPHAERVAERTDHTADHMGGHNADHHADRAAEHIADLPDAHPADREAREARVRRLKSEAAQLTADVANRVALLTHVLDDRARALHHHRLTLGRAFSTLGGEGLARLAAGLLADLSRYPAEVADPVHAAYSAPARELLLRVELPRLSAVPPVSGYRYLPSRGDIVADPRRPEDVRALYRDLTARFVLRTLDYAFAVTSPDLVDAVVLDGYLRATDPVADLPVHPCLASVRVTREAFEELDLDRADRTACLASIRALISANPYELEPVRPRLDFDDEVVAHALGPAVLDDLGERPDLLGLAPAEFEQLVRTLLEAMGYGAWVTRAVHEDGVDAVAAAPVAAGGGLCVVRASRSAKAVPIAVVRELAASVVRTGASQGILVTTAWFSNADRECARRSGRLRLVDGSALRRLLAEHLYLDAVVGLSRLPVGWAPGDIG